MAFLTHFYRNRKYNDTTFCSCCRSEVQENDLVYADFQYYCPECDEVINIDYTDEDAYLDFMGAL